MNLESLIPFALIIGVIALLLYVIFKNRITQSANTQIVLPLRLQAYERMILFLERISPNNLLLRIASQADTTLELQRLLLQEIRQEFNHNLAQQVYISHDAWENIKLAMNSVVAHINAAASENDPTGVAIQLSKKILENDTPAVSEAIKQLKTEVQGLF